MAWEKQVLVRPRTTQGAGRLEEAPLQSKPRKASLKGGRDESRKTVFTRGTRGAGGAAWDMSAIRPEELAD